MNIADLVGVIPDLFQLFFPGLIFMFVLIWYSGKKIETQYIILWSIIISVAIQSVCGIIHDSFFTGYAFSTNLKTIIYFLCGALTGLFTGWLIQTKGFQEMLQKFFHKTPNSSIFQDTFDFGKEMGLRLYMKNSNICYVGTLSTLGKDGYIAIIDYMVIDATTFETLTDYSGNKTIAILNLQDISRIETIYNDGSKKWKLLHE